MGISRKRGEEVPVVTIPTRRGGSLAVIVSAFLEKETAYEQI